MIVPVSSFWRRRLSETSNQVCLTFDDGPVPETTPALLRCLEKLSIPAVHFLVGEKGRANASLVRDIVQTGHTVANHGNIHRSFLWQSASAQRESIAAAEATLAHFGSYEKWFRPPYGHMNLHTKSILRTLGYRGALWSLMANDWAIRDERLLWERISSRLHSGAVIVMHDGHPATFTVIKMLPRLADAVQGRGWTFTRHLFPPPSPGELL